MDIKLALQESIDRLQRDDRFLLKYDVHEQAICHRLAVYLEPLFRNFHVDCEYNSNLDSSSGRKEVYYPSSEKPAYAKPDIIVHHRGLNGPNHNLLVVELKKVGCEDDALEKDREKLCSYTSEGGPESLGFRFGALLVVGVKEEAGKFYIQWFEGGSPVE